MVQEKRNEKISVELRIRLHVECEEHDSGYIAHVCSSLLMSFYSLDFVLHLSVISPSFTLIALFPK